MNRNLTAMIGCGALLVATGTYAGDNDHPLDNSCYKINLRNAATPPPVPFITFMVLPEDSNGDGWFETVVKVRVNDPSLKKSPEAVEFLVTYGGEPTGVSVNVGDSQTNDGFGGDAATQSNDAELNIGDRIDLGLTDNFEDLYIFGHDGTRAPIAYPLRKMVKQHETLSLTVSNERLAYANKDYPISGVIKSPWLYALNGQPDTEGPVNYDIYAAFNRVIAGSYRIGSGVETVEICLIAKLDVKEHDGKGRESKLHH